VVGLQFEPVIRRLKDLLLRSSIVGVEKLARLAGLSTLVAFEANRIVAFRKLLRTVYETPRHKQQTSNDDTTNNVQHSHLP
jgi:hypothetical protein